MLVFSSFLLFPGKIVHFLFKLFEIIMVMTMTGRMAVLKSLSSRNEQLSNIGLEWLTKKVTEKKKCWPFYTGISRFNWTSRNVQLIKTVFLLKENRKLKSKMRAHEAQITFISKKQFLTSNTDYTEVWVTRQRRRWRKKNTFRIFCIQKANKTNGTRKRVESGE